MPLEDNIPLVGTCCLNHMGIKGHLTHQAALDLLRSSKAGAGASRVCTALQEESRDKRDRNSVSHHCEQWVGECLQKIPIIYRRGLLNVAHCVPLTGRSALATLGEAGLPEGCTHLVELEQSPSWEGVRWTPNLSQLLFSQHLLSQGKMTNCLLNYLRYY